MIQLKNLTQTQQVLRACDQYGKTFKVICPISWLVEGMKKHLEKQNLKGKIKCPGH
jgi:hypothetical protein